MATIIVANCLVAFPLGGHIWHPLHYLLGFRALRHEVYYFEENDYWSYGYPRYFDPARNEMVETPEAGLAYLERVMARVGLAGRWCFLDAVGGGGTAGMSAAELQALVRSADVFVNVSGIAWLPPGGERIPIRIFVDTDPVFTQVRAASGEERLLALLSAHTRHVTFGVRIGRPDCQVPPTPGVRWWPTRQPIALEYWPESPAEVAGPVLTTVTNWDRKPVTWQGQTLGGKELEFEPYMGLPRLVARPLEMAASSRAPRDRLAAHGWRLADPRVVSADPWGYAEYIRGSAGEWSVAAQANVRMQTGWFGDRSAAYLASGRPVILQETGFGRWLPTGEGLLAFRTPAEAREAIERLDEDYPGHCHAARQIAERHFAAETVLGELLDEGHYR
jgi:hypothetical protein